MAHCLASDEGQRHSVPSPLVGEGQGGGRNVNFAMTKPPGTA
jgi:hypothetical protein